MKVQTKITNFGKSNFIFTGAKGKRISIRGGETMTFPYDLFSVLSRQDIKEVEKAAVKGLIDIKTEVITDKNVLSINSTGDVNINIAQPETAPAFAPPITAAGKKHTEEAKPDMGPTGKVVTKSSAAMAAYGATTSSNLDGKIKDIEIKNGERVEKAEEIFTPTRNLGNTQQAVNTAVDAHNVFPNGTSATITGEEKAPTENEQITIWLQEKNYSAVYEWLEANHPLEFGQTTKTAIRKCKTFEDLRTLLDI